jgi:hypothetical protein
VSPDLIHGRDQNGKRLRATNERLATRSLEDSPFGGGFSGDEQQGGKSFIIARGIPAIAVVVVSVKFGCVPAICLGAPVVFQEEPV